MEQRKPLAMVEGASLLASVPYHQTQKVNDGQSMANLLTCRVCGLKSLTGTIDCNHQMTVCKECGLKSVGPECKRCTRENILVAAKAIALMYYRLPPIAEGGDYFANMSALREALIESNEWPEPEDHDKCTGCPDCKGIVWRGPGD